MQTELNIDGMSCAHCVKHVTEALSKLDGVKNVSVSLAAKKADVEHDESVSLDVMKKAVEDAGFDIL